MLSCDSSCSLLLLFIKRSSLSNFVLFNHMYIVSTNTAELGTSHVVVEF